MSKVAQMDNRDPIDFYAVNRIAPANCTFLIIVKGGEPNNAYPTHFVFSRTFDDKWIALYFPNTAMISMFMGDGHNICFNVLRELHADERRIIRISDNGCGFSANAKRCVTKQGNVHGSCNLYQISISLATPQ